MIINTRQDLDAAPADAKDSFMALLALGINSWSWADGQWTLQQNTATIERFGFTLADFSDAPVPEMPDYNPDAQAAEQLAEEIRTERDRLLSASDWTQVADAPVDQAAWAEYRQALRDVPEQEGFPENVVWPTEPAGE
jgi:hypothetical protein